MLSTFNDAHDGHAFEELWALYRVKPSGFNVLVKTLRAFIS
jgi:hypothetical protein